MNIEIEGIFLDIQEGRFHCTNYPSNDEGPQSVSIGRYNESILIESREEPGFELSINLESEQAIKLSRALEAMAEPIE